MLTWIFQYLCYLVLVPSLIFCFCALLVGSAFLPLWLSLIIDVQCCSVAYLVCSTLLILYPMIFPSFPTLGAWRALSTWLHSQILGSSLE